ncbi:MAG: helix-turn-helix transcriptional regulator [Verrucomicrobiales bacterium]|nr:helix-turn-helix transcriptional regulator [Verrucomicrobiales bacterium]
MSRRATNPPSAPPLTPAVFHVLLALAHGEQHGYAIMQGVRESTQGAIKMGPGTLYGTIKRLLAAGWIEECESRLDPEVDDERRRYYRLSGQGRRALEAEARRYEAIVRATRSRGILPGTAAVTT